MEDYLAIVNGKTATALGHAYSKKQQVEEEEAKTSRSPPSVLDATQIGGRLGMNHHKKLITSPSSFPGWYADISLTWPGEGNLYEVEKVLFHGKSQYQEFLIFQRSMARLPFWMASSKLTEKEEFTYQEMLTNLPLCSIPNPKKVLLMGGGDEGILREISCHSSVEQVDICEINAMVVNVYMQFFPDIAVGYKDPRVRLHVGDGTGAVELADENFLNLVTRALRPGGLFCAPADSIWLDQFKVEETIAKCRQVFKGSVNYAWSTVPAYIRGMIGFMLYATEGPAINFKNPINPLDVDDYGVAKGPVRFYNSEVHTAAFWLPSFARRRATPKS